MGDHFQIQFYMNNKSLSISTVFINFQFLQKRYHDQGNLQEKRLNWGLAYSFRKEFMSTVVWSDGKQTGMALQQQLRAQLFMHKRETTRANWKGRGHFKTQSPSPSKTHFPTRPYLTILPEKLGIKYSNTLAYGCHFHLNHDQPQSCL